MAHHTYTVSIPEKEEFHSFSSKTKMMDFINKIYFDAKCYIACDNGKSAIAYKGHITPCA